MNPLAIYYAAGIGSGITSDRATRWRERRWAMDEVLDGSSLKPGTLLASARSLLQAELDAQQLEVGSLIDLSQVERIEHEALMATSSRLRVAVDQAAIAATPGGAPPTQQAKPAQQATQAKPADSSSGLGWLVLVALGLWALSK